MKSLFILFMVAISFVNCLNAQSEIKDPLFTEKWGPKPAVVTPGEGTMPPSDALILFDGEDLDMWVGRDGKPAQWEVKDGVMTIARGSGAIRTRNAFGDCQLHIEWRTPEKVKGEGQGRGNSGIFFMGNYELQVLDSYNNRTYVNGQAGSIYKEHAPLVNACRPPGEWQTFDVVFMAPRFYEDGNLLQAARMTVFQNGILIHNNVEIAGTTSYIGLHEYTPHLSRLPLSLQDHGNPVSYRNIWIRDL